MRRLLFLLLGATQGSPNPFEDKGKLCYNHRGLCPYDSYSSDDLRFSLLSRSS
jgi:hypothetical protein